MDYLQKISFVGMNKDDDARLLQPGEYRDALNCRIGSSKEDTRGTCENIPSTVLLENYIDLEGNTITPPSGLNTPIGSHDQEDENRIFVFWDNDQGNHFITALDVQFDNVIEIIRTSRLTFSRLNLITGTGFINDTLYWTDGLNEVRQLNIKQITDNPTLSDDAKAEMITMIKRIPETRLSNNIHFTVPPGTSRNVLEGQVYFFAYRYVYKDKTRTALSQHIGPNVTKWNECNSGTQSFLPIVTAFDIRFRTTFELGTVSSELIDKIELCVKRHQDEPWAVTDIIDYEKLKAGGGDPYVGPLVYKWKKYAPQFFISDDEATKFGEAIPFSAGALSIAKNRVIIADINEDYEEPQVLSNAAVVIDFHSSANRQIAHGIHDIDQPDYRFGIMYKDKYGRTNGVSPFDQDNTTLNNSGVKAYEKAVPGNANIRFQGEVPPTWATSWTFCRTPHLKKGVFKQFKVPARRVKSDSNYKDSDNVPGSFIAGSGVVQDASNFVKWIDDFTITFEISLDVEGNENFLTRFYKSGDWVKIPYRGNQIENQFVEVKISSSSSELLVHDLNFWRLYSVTFRDKVEWFPNNQPGNDLFVITTFDLLTKNNGNLEIDLTPYIEGGLSYVFTTGDRISIPSFGTRKIVDEGTGAINWIPFDAPIVNQDGGVLTFKNPLEGDMGTVDLKGGVVGGSSADRFPDDITIELYTPVTGLESAYIETEIGGEITDGTLPTPWQSIHNQADRFSVYQSNFMVSSGDISDFSGRDDILDTGILPSPFTDVLKAVFKIQSMVPFEDLDPSNNVRNVGRSVVPLTDLTNTQKKTTVRFGQPFVQDTNRNNLGLFNGLDFKAYPAEVGRIRKLQAAANTQTAGNFVLAICEEETMSLYLQENVFREVSGSPIVGVSDLFLASFNILQKGFGTTHPESIVGIDGQVFGFDASKGVVWRYGANGMIDISANGMKTFFSSLGAEMIATETDSQPSRAYAGFDYFHSEYILTIGPINSTVTLAFNNGIGRWTSFYSFIPRFMGRIDNKFYSFPVSTNQASHFLHSAGLGFSSFYGTRFDQSITLVGNAIPSEVKIWETLNIESNQVWSVPEISNNKNQSTNLVEDDFQDEEGVFYASILRDVNTPVETIEIGQTSLINGDYMRSYELIVKLVNPNTTEVILREANIGFLISKGHNTRQG